MAGTLTIDTLQSSTTGPAVFKNTSGVEVGQLCRAWVNWNGLSQATIRASFNVSSVVRNGTGDFTINFTNALTDGNYAIATSSGVVSGVDTQSGLRVGHGSGGYTAPSATSLRVGCVTDSASSWSDNATYVTVAVFR